MRSPISSQDAYPAAMPLSSACAHALPAYVIVPTSTYFAFASIVSMRRLYDHEAIITLKTSLQKGSDRLNMFVLRNFLHLHIVPILSNVTTYPDWLNVH